MCQLHSKAGLLSRNSWPAQAGLHRFCFLLVCLFCLFILERSWVGREVREDIEELREENEYYQNLLYGILKE